MYSNSLWIELTKNYSTGRTKIQDSNIVHTGGLTGIVVQSRADVSSSIHSKQNMGIEQNPRRPRLKYCIGDIQGK